MTPREAPIASLILQTATRFVLSLMLLLSIFLLLRGHNDPGGGFIGGLVASIAFVLYGIAFNVPDTRALLHVNPRALMGSGLIIAAFAGIMALIAGEPFLTGLWLEVDLPILGNIDLSTTLVFDIGVYLVVIGVTLTIILTLLDDSRMP